MEHTDWDAIERRYEEYKVALAYMEEHQLTHEQAIEQTVRLKRQVLEPEEGGT